MPSKRATTTLRQVYNLSDNITTNTNSRSIRILQINLQRSKATSSLLIENANKLDADILLIQEPYIINNKIVRFGGWQILAKQGEKKPKSRIIVRNDNIDIVLVPHLSNNIITTTVLHQEPEIYMSIYLAPSEDYIESIKNLEQILRKINSKTLIGDFAFKSPATIWFSPKEDERGRQLNLLMEEMDLVSGNMSTIPMFFTVFAKRWNDICLISNDFMHKINSCETLTTTTTSDHRIILTEIKGTKILNNNTGKRIQTLTNWELFRENFARNWRNFTFKPAETTEDVDSCIDHVTRAIQLAGQQAARPKKTEVKKVWWTSELTAYKRRVRKIRKKMERSRNKEEEKRMK
ncbi:uncharacterized protein LOC111614230 [Centruroides sculpturatus]|uniref:uncharacterized protein LOC111614230 n=1 Tax=Centruroides sculpturatus TaxID=218467 RepID=UPI000C6D167B|nr:uncharacterized protein LOC111614230 [Centruroides sculpturatus]